MLNDDSFVTNFWRVNYNSADWSAQQSKEFPRKTANLILLNPYFLLGVVGWCDGAG